MSRELRFGLAAIICAVLAAVLTYRAASGSDRAPGPSVPVVVVREPLPSATTVGEDDVATLEVRKVPKEFAPPDTLSDPVDAIGRRTFVELPAGSLLTDAVLGDPASSSRAFGLRRGERAVSVDVVVSPAGDELAPGARVDLFASGIGGSQRTSELIRGAEVLAVGEGRDAARPIVTMRLGQAQVARVVRADVFARELRAVKLPQGHSR
jgi:Flp pilus assembly protein CpaB